MQLVSAPGRQFRTYSMWLVIIGGVFDLGIVLANTLSADHLISATTLALVNAVLAFAVGTVRLIQQQVPFTTEQKVDALTDLAQQPMKSGETPVEVRVDGQRVSPG